MTLIPSPAMHTQGQPAYKQFFGSYAASIADTHDPLNQGRCRLQIPQVLGTAVSDWAKPVGFGYSATVGQVVVCSFLGGDINRPCFTPVNTSTQQLSNAGGATVIQPSGDTSGKIDIAMINSALSNNQSVTMTPGSWFINSPIVVPSFTSLTGAFPMQSSQNDNYGAGTLVPTGGTRITAVGSSWGSHTGIIEIINTTVSQKGGQVLRDFYVEGNQTGGQGIAGIALKGAVAAGTISGVEIHRPDSHCIVALPGTGGYVPDDWTIRNNKFSASRNGWGAFLSFLDDSWVTDNESSENDLGGWYVDHGDNTRFTGNKGENNFGPNWRFTGLNATQKIQLSNCTSQFGTAEGFLFDSTTSTAQGTYILTGCRSFDDGTSGVTLGGFRSNGCKSRIIMTGCVSYVGGTQNAYGAYEGGSSFGMALTGCYMKGGTGTVFDDGTNTNILSHLADVPF